MEGGAQIIGIFIIIVVIMMIVSIIGAMIGCIFSYDIDDLEFTCTVTDKYVDNGRAYIIVTCDDVVKNIKVTIDQYASVQIGDTCVVLAKGWHDVYEGDQYTFEFLYKVESEV